MPPDAPAGRSSCAIRAPNERGYSLLRRGMGGPFPGRSTSSAARNRKGDAHRPETHLLGDVPRARRNDSSSFETLATRRLVCRLARGRRYLRRGSGVEGTGRGRIVFSVEWGDGALASDGKLRKSVIVARVKLRTSADEFRAPAILTYGGHYVIFTDKPESDETKLGGGVGDAKTSFTERPATYPAKGPSLSAGKMVPSIIGEDLTITGNVASKGEIQVDGEIQGEIRCSSLLVGDKAHVKGGVVAEDVVVRRPLDGNHQRRAHYAAGAISCGRRHLSPEPRYLR
jgi:hypothetical protein